MLAKVQYLTDNSLHVYKTNSFSLTWRSYVSQVSKQEHLLEGMCQMFEISEDHRLEGTQSTWVGRTTLREFIPVHTWDYPSPSVKPYTFLCWTSLCSTFGAYQGLSAWHHHRSVYPIPEPGCYCRSRNLLDHIVALSGVMPLLWIIPPQKAIRP